MKIVNVGNFDYKNALRTFFHTSRKLSHGLVRLGHSVFEFSDRDNARQHALLGMRKMGVRGANRALLETCRNIEPDLVLLGHADVIRPATLAEIRRMLPAVRIAQWNYDALYVADNIRRIEAKLDVVDATFVSTAGERMAVLARPGRLVAYLPNPVDASIETGRSFARDSHEHDLFFGMRNAKNFRRWDGQWLTGAEIAARLHQALPDFRLCLPGLEGDPVFGMDYIHAMERSLMGLSLSQESNEPFYASDRMAHLTGNGVLTFVDRSTGFGALYGEEDLPFYGSIDELLGKLRRFKAEPAEARALAERGWRRTHALFDGTRVARYLVEQLFRQPLSEEYGWPTEVR